MAIAIQTLFAPKTEVTKELLPKVKIVFAPIGQVIISVNQEKCTLSSGDLVVVCPNVIEKYGVERIPYIKVMKETHSFIIPLGYLKLSEKQKNDLVKTTCGYFHKADFDKPFPIHFRGLPLLN